VKIPVVRSGGVYLREDCSSDAPGATAVEVGAANLVDTLRLPDIVRALPAGHGALLHRKYGGHQRGAQEWERCDRRLCFRLAAQTTLFWSGSGREKPF
jgi:hypothetical protein